MLALAVHLPYIHFLIYNMDPKVPLPVWISNVKRVTTLIDGYPIICEHGWEAAEPYQKNDFSASLCIRKISRVTPDKNSFDHIITVSDINQDGDYPPVVLETPLIDTAFDPYIIISTEGNNRKFLKEKYPDYSYRVVYPVTSMRNSIKHIAGIAGYNLFWECAYYQIPCTLYPSVWRNDSHARLEKLGNDPMPPTFTNGAKEVALAMLQWWFSVI
ncbi:MAG: hypothetical protein HC921_21605 [Synechococcaceae cyanobacterium SM2_3_1]|nr:hypothetical protein [Synechococcaceae cyanobacterium SM2_3_1]